MGPQIVRTLGWDSDVSGPLVLAVQLRGHGTVYLPHISAWTSLWWELATRDLPFHVQLWQATGYAFAVAGAALVGWATGRVVGRRNGLTAAAAALVVGPLALRALFTLNFHVSTPFTAAVLGAFLVVIAKSRAWLIAIPVGILAGLNLASDPLLLPAGIVPFAIAAGVFAFSARRVRIAIHAGLALALAAVAALSANGLMHGLGYHVAGARSQRSPLHDLPHNVSLLGRMIALLGGANYALPGGYPIEPLRAVVALLVLLAAAAPLVAAAKHFIQPAHPLLRAYACYWGAVAIFLGIAFVGTTNAAALGWPSFSYLLALAPAAGAGVGLLSAGSTRAQSLAAIGVAVVGAVNIAGVIGGRAETPLGEVGKYERPLVRFLTHERVTRGYAGYWDAQNLTWQSGMRVRVEPVGLCNTRGKPLCAFRSSVIASSYRARPEPSFLIVDPTAGSVTTRPAFAVDATASRRFGRSTVYLFPYDIARYVLLAK